MSDLRIGMGEPIDPDDTPPLCPRCYSVGRADCCLRREWEETRASAVSSPDPDDRGLMLWQQVDRGWSRRYAADKRAWKSEVERLRILLGQTIEILYEELESGFSSERRLRAIHSTVEGIMREAGL